MIFRVESYSNKQNSSKRRLYFLASINKGQKQHVHLWRLRLRDTKIKSILRLGKFQQANLVQTGCWKWNRSCDWLISWKECGSVVSSRFFGGSVAWHPKKWLLRRLQNAILCNFLSRSILTLSMPPELTCFKITESMWELLSIYNYKRQRIDILTVSPSELVNKLSGPQPWSTTST